LGSDTFIPGFEANIVGMKAGDKKTFTLTFPKTYGVRALANKKVTFEVSVSKVQVVEEPKEDDEFAKKAGPFTTLAQLRDDIKTQLKIEREREATTKQQDEIVRTLVSKSSVDIPGELIEQQVEYSFNDLKQNLAQRGQTLKEFLDLEAKSESQYRDEVVRPQAENQLKTSLVLAEIADVEQLVVTPEELEVRLQLLKGQYQDPKMQAELDKEENRRDIASRLLSEKVLALISQ
jgi:trigger factor